MTLEERKEMLKKRDEAIWEQYLLYKSLTGKIVCEQWGLTYAGYKQVLFRIKRSK